MGTSKKDSTKGKGKGKGKDKGKGKTKKAVKTSKHQITDSKTVENEGGEGVTAITSLAKKKKDRMRKPRHKHVTQNQKKNARELLLAVLHQKKLLHAAKSLKKNDMHVTTETSNISNSNSNSNNSLLDVAVHRIRNLEYQPKAILRLASSHPSHHSILAISREGGGVEIYNPNQKWNCVGNVSGMPSRSVDALTWLSADIEYDYKNPNTPSIGGSSSSSSSSSSESTKTTSSSPTFSCNFHKEAYGTHPYRRLFGASISDGTIFEIDFTTQRHIRVTGSGGGAVFSLVTYTSCPPMNQKNPKTSSTGYLAAGCEDGSIRIFHIKDTKEDSKTSAALELVWTLPTAGAPVLSLAWKKSSHPSSSSSSSSSSYTTGLIGSTIYAGIADGTIRRYDCIPQNSSTSRNGVNWRASFRMTLENRGLSTPTQVWALQILSNNTLISGDSLGQVQFWDANTGILMQSFQQNSQSAPVLDVVVDEEEEKVFAAGVDSRVICIEKVKGSSSPSGDNDMATVAKYNNNNNNNPLGDWVLTHAHRPHTHDVRGLAICGRQDPTGGDSSWREEKLKNTSFLCSGGVDTKMCTYAIHNFREFRPKRIFHMPFTSPIRLAKGKRVISVMKDTKIDFFKLKKRTSFSDPELESSSHDLDGAGDNDNCIGTIDIRTRHNLVCSDLSQDGSLLAVSDAANLMLFQIQYNTHDDDEDEEDESLDITPSLIKVDKMEMKEACSALAFSTVENETRLFCATSNGPIHVLRLSRMDHEDTDKEQISVTLEHTFKDHLSRSSNPISSRPGAISQLVVSPDGKYLASGRNVLGNDSIHVFTNAPYQHHFSLPAMEAQHSALQFSHSEQSALVVGCVNNSFYIYDMESKSIGDWTKDAGFPLSKALPDELVYRQEYAVRLTFNPSTPDRFILGGHFFFCAIDLNQPIPEHVQLFPNKHIRSKSIVESKKRRRSRGNSFSIPAANNFSMETNESELMESKNFTICVEYNSMLFMDFIDADEMVVVERPWLSVVNALPGAMERRVYGS